MIIDKPYYHIPTQGNQSIFNQVRAPTGRQTDSWIGRQANKIKLLNTF